MIKLQLTGREYKIDEELRSYVSRKLGKLDRYLPRGHAAIGMQVEIFRDPSGKEDNRYHVRAVLEVAGPDLVAETAAMNPHAAVDIVAEKLRQQVHKYKDKHQPKRFRVKEWLSRSVATTERDSADNEQQ